MKTYCLIKHHYESVLGSGIIALRILNLGIKWKWVVSFMHRPLYPRVKSPRCPLDRRLVGPQSRSGRGGEKKKNPVSAPAGIWTSVAQPVA